MESYPPTTFHHGRYLTEAEICLSRLFEKKHHERAEELQAKRKERKIMAQRSLSLQQAADLSSKPKKVAVPEPPPPAKEPKKEEQKINPEPAASARAPTPPARGAKLTINDKPEPMEEEGSPEAPAVSQPVPAVPAKAIKKRALVDIAEDDTYVDTDPEALFSAQGLLSETPWKSSASNALSLECLLPAFAYKGKQTLALRLTVPNDANSWSFNICPARDYHNNNILLHFNPRYKKRTVVMTDKQGTWGVGKSRHFTEGATSKTDGLLAKDVTLVVQIRPDGYYVFANDMFNSFFPHRRDPATTSTTSTGEPGSVTDLKLIVNARDANGNRLDLEVNKIWWGRRDPAKHVLPSAQQGKADRAAEEERALQSRAVPFSDRSLMVRGLPVGQYDLVECQAVEFALNNVFEEFGFQDSAVVPGQGYGFVRLATSEGVDAAIADLDGAEIALTESKEGEAEAAGSVLQLSRMQL